MIDRGTVALIVVTALAIGAFVGCIVWLVLSDLG